MMQVLILAFLKRHLAAFVLIGSILLIGSFVYLKGWSDRGDRDKAAAQEHQINRATNRGKINEKVRKLDDAGLCGALGGVYRDDKCQ